jgi:hypothetical protein
VTTGFEILAFPCNQFGGQEPGTNEEIVQFACTRFKAEYPIFDKVNLCTILPFLYGYLKLKETIISFSLHYESSMNNHYHLLTKSNPTCVFYFYAAFDNSELTVGYHTTFCCTSNQLSFLYEMEQGEKPICLFFSSENNKWFCCSNFLDILTRTIYPRGKQLMCSNLNLHYLLG